MLAINIPHHLALDPQAFLFDPDFAIEVKPTYSLASVELNHVAGFMHENAGSFHHGRQMTSKDCYVLGGTSGSRSLFAWRRWSDGPDIIDDISEPLWRFVPEIVETIADLPAERVRSFNARQ